MNPRNILVYIIILFKRKPKPDPTTDNRPYWKRDKSFFQRAKIELAVKFRRFQTQTHNMGLLFLMLILLVVLVNIIPFITSYLTPTPDNIEHLNKLATCLKLHICKWQI